MRTMDLYRIYTMKFMTAALSDYYNTNGKERHKQLTNNSTQQPTYHESGFILQFRKETFTTNVISGVSDPDTESPILPLYRECLSITHSIM